MEAPKYLYLNSTGKLKDGISTGRFRDTDIEYIRTDIFIENACAWFRKVKEQECSFDGIDSFITHFKEAVKL